jgi:predicted permease
MRIGEWLRRLWYLINRRRLDRELQLEIEAHREMMDEPHRFGNALRLREESRDIWGWNWLDDLSRDLKIAFRNLRATPGFTAGAVLILSLGLGLSLSNFQVLNILTMRPLPVRDVDSLVQLNWRSKDGRSRDVLYASVPSVRSHTEIFSAVLTRNPRTVFWGEASKPLRGAFVSANWFDELGYGASFGRVLHEGRDDKPGAEAVAVVSHGFWERELGRDPNVAGLSVRINDRNATVVGVAAPDFPGTNYENTQIWLPVDQIEYFIPGTAFRNSWDESTILYGRLKAGATVNAAMAALSGVFDDLAGQQPAIFQKGDWLELFSGSNRFRNPAELQRERAAMGTLAALTILVLLIACANLGNLVLSRTLGRVRELCVRVALGASRTRIIRHMLAESLLLATMGLAGAFLTGYWGLQIAFRSAIADNPAYPIFEMDWRLGIAAVGGTVFVTIAIGLFPALKISREDLSAGMKDGGQQTTAGLERTRMRSTLVAVQVGGTCVFLLLAGLFVRGFQRMQADPGYDLENVAVLRLARDRSGLKGEEGRAHWTAVREAIATHPETQGAVIVSHAPLGMTGTSIVTWPKDTPGLRITLTHVEPEFFDLLRVPLLAGRIFDSSDDPETTVLISRRVAMAMFGSLDIAGSGYPRSKPLATIAGVVEDARVVRIEETEGGQMYMPLNWKEASGQAQGHALLVRARSNVERLVTPIVSAARLHDERFVPQVRLVKTEYENRLRDERNRSLAVSALGSVSLLLASLGIFSVVSYGAALRRKEIGIRLALGANGRVIVGLLIEQLMRPVLIATAVGLAIGLIVGKIVQTEQANIRLFDPGLLIFLAVVVLFSGAAASLIPTLRALRSDVLQALRHE